MNANERATCQWDGCDKPRGPLPSKVAGAEAYCGGHRGGIASKRAREAAKVTKAANAAEAQPAPLAVPDTEPMAAPPVRDPVLASIAPIANEGPVWLRIYTIGPKQDVLRIRTERDKLHTIEGVAVRASWIDIVEPDAVDPTDHAAARRLHDLNYAELSAADVVIAYTNEAYGRETYAEIRQAIAEGKLVFWSLERGGRSLSYDNERVIPAPLDSDVIRTIRNLARDWRRVA